MRFAITHFKHKVSLRSFLFPLPDLVLTESGRALQSGGRRLAVIGGGVLGCSADR